MQLFKNKFMWLCAVSTIFISWNCSVGNALDSAAMPDISEDAKLGAQVSQEIESNPKEYPILPERGNEEVYTYVRGITSKILNSGAVENRNAFPWKVKIINNSKTY